MYNGTQMRYLFQEGLFGLARRKVSGSVAIVIMGSSLLMLALFSLVTINLDRILQSARDDIDVTVYLRDDIHPEDQGILYKDLVSTHGVRSVSFVSREQALENFRAELGDDADLLEAVKDNPLPASYELRLEPEILDAAHLNDLTRSLSQYPGVEEVVTQVEWIHRLDRFARIFLWVDVIVGALVLLSALFVISNTVRLTIEEGARQVRIMKLVGATDWFIRTPYVMGGALQGAAAGLLAMLVLLFAHRILRQQVPGVYFFGPEQMLGFVILSTVLGAAGSLIALRRHLRL